MTAVGHEEDGSFWIYELNPDESVKSKVREATREEVDRAWRDGNSEITSASGTNAAAQAAEDGSYWIVKLRPDGSIGQKVREATTEEVAKALRGQEEEVAKVLRGQEEEDFKKAAMWYREASSAGNLDAACALGRFHQEGLGVPKNEKVAHSLFSQGARSDNAVCQFLLGSMIVSTGGSLVDAYHWLRRAAENGDERAQRLRAKVEQAMTAEEMAQALRQTLE